MLIANLKNLFIQTTNVIMILNLRKCCSCDLKIYKVVTLVAILILSFCETGKSIREVFIFYFFEMKKWRRTENCALKENIKTKLSHLVLFSSLWFEAQAYLNLYAWEHCQRQKKIWNSWSIECGFFFLFFSVFNFHRVVEIAPNLFRLSDLLWFYSWVFPHYTNCTFVA